MRFFNKFLSVKKRTLLLIAGLVWGFAGIRVLTLGMGDIIVNHGSIGVDLVVAAIVFSVFFKLVFKKMFNKHTKRIISSNLEKHCIFSFFDIKSYFIMGFMIFLGISIRNLSTFNAVYVGTFYIGLGASLFMAGILFLLSSLNFKKIILKFNN